MIEEHEIKVKYKDTGVYLSVTTKQNKYGQFYDILDPAKSNFVPDILTAKKRFMSFYNQFED